MSLNMGTSLKTMVTLSNISQVSTGLAPAFTCKTEQ
jgi:hypothetical protein